MAKKKKDDIDFSEAIDKVEQKFTALDPSKIKKQSSIKGLFKRNSSKSVKISNSD